MPELPEVEAVARSLRPLVLGRLIRSCEVVHPIAVRPATARELARRIAGARVANVVRRGKYLVLKLAPRHRGCLVIHFRLDGQLLWFDSKRVSGHVDVVLHFKRGVLGFVDRRHFGRVLWYATRGDCAGIRTLGVDPLTARFTPSSLHPLLRASRRPLKLFLTDQTRIAGLGNIYSSESLWRAKLDTRRLTHRISKAEARRLHKGIVGVLQRALECCLDPAPDFRDPDWWFQGLERILGVYDRRGAPCRRCRKRIRRIEQGGRSTCFCLGCQR